MYPPDQAILVVRSVDKLFDVELALMLRHYQLDSEERLVVRERQIQADRITALQTMTAGLAHPDLPLSAPTHPTTTRHTAPSGPNAT